MNFSLPFLNRAPAVELKGRTVVITGAGSGIGQALALEFARKGANLALADIDQDHLQVTLKKVAYPGIKARTYKLDVSNRKAVYKFSETVMQEFGQVDIVINNAGVALSETIEDMQYEDFEWLMGINFWGVVYGTKAFLPYLKRSDQAFIVNISSVFGLISVPMQGAYNASKFAVRGFTEALRLELEGSSVTPVCVHPGGIKTNIARNARFFKGSDGSESYEEAMAQFDKQAKTSPAKAAQTIVRGIESGNLRVLIGLDAYVIDFIQRVLPVRYSALIKQLIRFSKRT